MSGSSGQGTRAVARNTDPFLSASDQQNTSSLLWGVTWNGANITYSFPDSSAYYGTPSSYGNDAPFDQFQPLATDQRTEATRAFELIESYSGVTFTKVTESATTHATIRFANSWGGDAFSFRPSNSVSGGDVFLINSQRIDTIKGNFYSARHVLKDTAHALGLNYSSETHRYGQMETNRLSIEYSLMNNQDYLGDPDTDSIQALHFPRSYMMYDIAAFQHMFGADFTQTGKERIYSWSSSTGTLSINGRAQLPSVDNKVFETVWTQGATSTFDLSNFSDDQVDDMRAGGVMKFSQAQLADLAGRGSLGPGKVFAMGNVYNALLYQGDTRSLIDNLITGSGNDTVQGNEVANAITTGVGSDVVSGGAGDDVVRAGTYDNTYDRDREHDTVNGNEGNDKLYGGMGNDTLNGDGGNDVLYGEDDADTLRGGDGIDTLVGGQGWDTYYVTDANDTIVEAAGIDKDTVRASVNYTLASNVEVLYLEATAIDGVGNALDNEIYGSSLANTLNGQDGNDLLRGGAGDDTLIGGIGNDTLHGDSGSDTVSYEGASSAVTVTLGIAGAQNTGGAGMDTFSSIENLRGSAWNDTLTGDGNDNRLDGGGGVDVLSGGLGIDTAVLAASWLQVAFTARPGGGWALDFGANRVTTAGVERFQFLNGTFNADNSLFNDAPVGVNDSDGSLREAGWGQAGVANVGGNVLANDTDLDAVLGDFLTVTGIRRGTETAGGAFATVVPGGIKVGGTYGTLTIGPTGAWTYALDNGDADTQALKGGQEATETFTYRVADGHGIVDSAQLTLKITGTDDVALADHGYVSRGTSRISASALLRNDKGSGLFIQGVGNAVNGTAAIEAGGNVLFTAGGTGATARFDYTASNGAESDTASVRLDLLSTSANNDKISVASLAGEFSWVDGLAGIDTIVGGAGADTFLGGIGNDTLNGKGGDDVLNGGQGSDTLGGNETDDAGQDLAVYEVANAGFVVIRDSLEYVKVFDTNGTGWTGTGHDKVYNGVERIVFTDANLLVGSLSLNQGWGTALLRGMTGNDNIKGFLQVTNEIRGGVGNDVLTGGDLADRLFGDMGNDRLIGGRGGDALLGGAGNDIYAVDSAGDVVREDGVPGVDDGGADTVEASVTFTLGTFLENLTLIGAAVINGTGNDLANRLTGNAAANRLIGFGGADILSGGGGADTMDGGEGSDVYYADASDAIADTGASGVDTIKFLGPSYALSEGGGVENLLAAEGNARGGTMTGNSLANRLTGNEGDNLIRGLVGDDTIIGGVGNDRLEGGMGRDQLTGGDGSDLFIMKAGDSPVGATGADTIVDFATGLDRIDLHTVTSVGLPAADYAERLVASNNFVALRNAAIGAMADGLHSVVFVAGLSNGWLFWNTDGDLRTPEQAAQLVGLNNLSMFDRVDIA